MAWTPRRFARNGAVDLAYDQLQEATDGEPLLLVMGLAVSRYWWPHDLCTALADAGFAVARYDQRDAGESTRLTQPTARGNPFAALASGRRTAAYTAEDMADDAIAVMDALGWQTAHIFGHSLGGVIAQRIALRHPDRVRTLTSSAALPSDVSGLGALRHLRLGTLAKFARIKPARDREGRIAAALAVARLCASPGYPFDEAEALERITADVDTSVADPDAQSRQIGAPWNGPSLAELRLPALVLHGTDDPLLKPSAGRATAAAIRDARLVLQPGVGHDTPRERRTSVAAEVRALANRNQASHP
ncbi:MULTISPECIES: alpha/beta fold hydrolase [unclassified Streptomyces]|uniref:alpha/beta fold hydrolase n=1 Tax=unclassified Streptomyces TaxID=2593676 RepID=UPI000DACCFD0|nr:MULTISPECIES: alpha/beta hydrolase [unclassified Streptomyces]PZT73662.1 alpha/beta hydrolase [Streptomyces sp. AC1-42T]PZT83344.1 alpha/beta hydrolase [Streptomyces sp. AC1-42W]